MKNRVLIEISDEIKELYWLSYCEIGLKIVSFSNILCLTKIALDYDSYLGSEVTKLIEDAAYRFD